MELKLKDDDQPVRSITDDSKTPQFSQMGGDDVYRMDKSAIKSAKSKPSGNGLDASDNMRNAFRTVISIILFVAVCFGVYMIYINFVKSVDITLDAAKSQQEFASKYAMSFTTSQDDANHAIQFAKHSVVTANANKDIAFLYLNKTQMGIMLKDGKYSIYGIRVGDAADYDVQKKLTYESTGFIEIPATENDLRATAIYYNKQKNDCLMVTRSTVTNHVDMITYYTNFKKVCASLDY